MPRLICPACGRGVWADEQGIVEEHNDKLYLMCHGSYMKGAPLVQATQDPPPGVETNTGDATPDPGDVGERNLPPTRQHGLRAGVPSSPPNDRSSLSSGDRTPPAAVEPTNSQSSIVFHAPKRADGRNCREDVTCVREHGHQPPCLPYMDRRREPTISEVICRRKPRCVLVAGHKGFCYEL